MKKIINFKSKTYIKCLKNIAFVIFVLLLLQINHQVYAKYILTEEFNITIITKPFEFDLDVDTDNLVIQDNESTFNTNISTNDISNYKITLEDINGNENTKFTITTQNTGTINGESLTIPITIKLNENATIEENEKIVIKIESLTPYSKVQKFTLPVEELKISHEIEFGDYATYSSDISVVNPEGAALNLWRVWDVNENEVVITPSRPIGAFPLGGWSAPVQAVEHWLNAETLINNECKRYTSSSLGITSDNIRSMALEDITEKIEYTYSEPYTLEYDSNQLDFKFIQYESNGETVTVDSYANAVSPTLYDTVTVKSTLQTFYPGTDGNASVETKNMVVDILGTGYENLGWLASKCTYCPYTKANCYYSVYYAYGDNIGASGLFYAGGYTDYIDYYGIRPLITLDTSKLTITGEGTSSSPWQFTLNSEN